MGWLWDHCPEFRKHFRTIANFTINQNLKWVKFLRDLKLEGLRQALKPNLPIGPVIFWIATFFVMLITASTFAGMQIIEDHENPVEVLKAAKDKSIDSIAATALTICNVNHIRKSKADEARNCLNTALMVGKCVDTSGVTWTLPEAVELYLHIDHRCNIIRSYSKQTENGVENPENELGLRNLKKWVNATNVEMINSTAFSQKIKQFLNESIQSCDHLVAICSWAGSKPIPCKGHFYPVETDAGRCCVINAMPEELLKKYPGSVITDDVIQRHNESEAWNSYNIQDDLLQINKSRNSNETHVPRRQFTAGKRGGITVILNPDQKEQFCSSHDGVGFKVAVHPPDEIAEMETSGRFVPADSEVMVSVKAGVRLAEDSNLEFVPLEKRGCLMPNEKPVEYYNNYTKNNCINECVSKRTDEKCKCLMAYMPKAEVPKHKKLCGPNEIECVEEVRATFDHAGYDALCPHCLQRCNEVTYEINDVTSLPLQKSYPMWGIGISWANDNVTILHISITGPIVTYVLKKTNTFGNIMARVFSIVGFVMDINLPQIMQMFYTPLAVLMALICALIRKYMFLEEPIDVEEPRAKDADTQTDDLEILPTAGTQTTLDVGTQTIATTSCQTTSDMSAQTSSIEQSQAGTSQNNNTSFNGQPRMEEWPTVRITIDPPTDENQISEDTLTCPLVQRDEGYLTLPSDEFRPIMEQTSPIFIRVQPQSDEESHLDQHEDSVVVNPNRRSRIPIRTRQIDPDLPDNLVTTFI